ncbi:MAG: ornithine cyclodeaminase family protein [Firmicutes bacterium]|nr:ornithine cyclodeaminase family protein [Bacillota bacterium]
MTEIALITQQEVVKKLNMRKAIDIVEKVFQTHGENQVLMPSKITLDLGESNDWPPYGGSFNAMPAYLGNSFDMSGIKWVWGFSDNPKKGLPYISGTILLNDPRTGEQLVMMDGAYITDIRTGAATAVAIKYLARKDSKTVGIIGAGVQGRMNLYAAKEVLNIEKAYIIDIQEKTALSFASDLSKELGIEILVKKTNKEVVENADIVITTTIANEPLVMNEWLKEGSLVLSIGSFIELDENIPLYTDKLIVDCWEQNSHRGELLELVKAGRITKENIYAELPEIVAGLKNGRENNKEKICACLIGMGSADIGIAATLYKEFKEEGFKRLFHIR